MRGHLLILGAFVLAAAQLSTARADDRGKIVYEKSCVTCHGANGKGALPGVPDMTAKGGMLSLSDAVLVKRMTEGFQSPGSPMPMPPKGGNASLTEEDLKQALSYMKREFAK